MAAELFLYDRFLDDRLSNAELDWDDAAAGAFMWILATKDYVPNANHALSSDLSNVIAAGDGAPINVTSRDIDNTTIAGDTWLNSDAANFGTPVTIIAKYLICVVPVVAGTYDPAASKLAFYVDLNTASGTAEIEVTGTEFRVDPPANGWMNFKKSV